MVIDWTISLGNILTVLGFAGSGIAFVAMMRSDMRLLSYRVGELESAVKTLAHTNGQLLAITTRLSGQDERINMISRRMDECLRQCRLMGASQPD